MKPLKYSPAHHLETFAELVCSNSLRSDRLENAVGLLKEEMRIMDSLIMRCADAIKSSCRRSTWQLTVKVFQQWLQKLLKIILILQLLQEK